MALYYPAALLFNCAEGLYTVKYNHNTDAVKLEKFTSVFDNIFLTTIFQDTNGIIWAASENGIYSFDPVSYKLNLFDHSDNVQGYGFNNNSCFRNNDGIVFLGGINGVNYFQPESFETSEEKLQVYISRAKTARTILYCKRKMWRWIIRSNSLEIELLAPTTIPIGKIPLPAGGFDYEWKNLENTNTLQFTSLPRGLHPAGAGEHNGVDWVSLKIIFV